MYSHMQFNIIYIMRTNIELDGIQRFVVMIALVADAHYLSGTAPDSSAAVPIK